MIRLLQKILRRVMAPQFDIIETRINALEQVFSHTSGTIETNMASLIRHIENLEGDYSSSIDSTGEYLQDLTGAIQNIQRRLEEIAVPIAGLEAVPWMSDSQMLTTQDELGRQTIGFSLNVNSGPEVSEAHDKSPYLFQDIFRGSEDFIRDRQRVYLDYLSGADEVADLGCGRGEMLDLLQQAGIKAVGIDLDEAVILGCRAKGHSVLNENAIAWLRSQEDGSISHIFSAQFVEHLEYSDLMELLNLSLRKLRPGGRLIAETVNPHSVGAWKTFWVDPTHKIPLFPESLTALLNSVGFASAFVIFPNGTGVLAKDRSTEGEYAVIATAPG